MDRQVELVIQEAQRRRAMSRLDEPHWLEHLEVTAALLAAAKALERSESPCRSETRYGSHRRRSARRSRARCRDIRKCLGK